MNDRLTYAERDALLTAALGNLKDVTSHPMAYIFGMMKMLMTDEQVRDVFARTQDLKAGE